MLILVVLGVVLFAGWNWIRDPEGWQQTLVASAVVGGAFALIYMRSTRALISRYAAGVRIAGVATTALGIAGWAAFLSGAMGQMSESGAELAGAVFTYLLLIGAMVALLPTVIKLASEKTPEARQ
jgi:hypothetical protein